VGSNSAKDFPAIQMRRTNSPTTILFNLTASQKTNLNLRIGITCAYNNGRPEITINGHAGSNPAASTQPNSRSFTTGTWRGNNATFVSTLSAADLATGQNKLVINPISGSTDLGPWLSAGWVYDAVELDAASAPNPPAAPDGLKARRSDGGNRLAWVSHSTNEVNFLVERSSDGTNFSLIGAVTFGVTNFTDSNPAAGAISFYRVRAGNADGYSAYSGVASAPLAFNNVYQMNGSLVLSGFGGASAMPYYIWATTNVELPIALWQPVATNYFGPSGDFALTNAVDMSRPTVFYQVGAP
jgi:rhamnogalacturonan endolyase